ncbi:hypothetical protein AGMMS50249_2970 [candidate division SR1 bacterium]|nr:hypothetical protein AGMMS50249_2970 [candidate division SR1 bacterium]
MGLERKINTFFLKIMFGKKYIKQINGNNTENSSVDSVRNFVKLGLDELKKEVQHKTNQ